MDFQSLYGQSLLSNPSITSQWLETAYYFDVHMSTTNKLSFYMRLLNTSLPFGTDLMFATRSNQTTYLSPGNYSL